MSDTGQTLKTAEDAYYTRSKAKRSWAHDRDEERAAARCCMFQLI
jgi:hypothetical protein